MVWNRNRRTTLVEWLTIFALFAVLAALMISGQPWASSGSLTIPVDVTIFDVLTSRPIENALVSIVWSPPASEAFALDSHEQLAGGLSAIELLGKRTDPSGRATIQQEFRTGANHTRPEPHAHTRWYWLLVSADGYGEVAVPLRYESLTTKSLKQLKRLPAYVGMAQSPRNVAEPDAPAP